MIHVALDTNIFSKKPRLDTPEFKALAFLAKNECVRLHVPFFVENEFKSQIELVQKKRIETVLATLDKMCEFPILGAKTTSLLNVIKTLGEIKEEIVVERGSDFIHWMSDLHAMRYTVNERETIDALSAYFDGKPPFKEPKVRKHIPDSFIFQSLLNIHTNNNLHVVVEDETLREACLSEGMTCYENLSELIECEEVKLLLQGKIDSDILGALETQIKEYLTNNTTLLLEKVEDKLLSDEYRMISGDYIPGEANEIYVSGVDIPHEMELIDNVEHYGGSLFVVDFSAKVNLLYEYAVYKTDAYDLDPKKYYLEYLNDHYFNVETTDEFKFNGRIELDYSVNLESVESVAELLASLSEPEVTIEELVDFEISS